MINLIKKRFIKVSMILSSLILFIILALINILNYYNTTNRMDNMLSNHNLMTTQKVLSNNKFKGNYIQNKKNILMNQRNLILYVNIDKNGNFIDESLEASLIYNKNDIIDIAQDVLKKGKDKGFTNEFRYLISDYKEYYHITFIDAQSDLYTLQYNIIFSLIVYIIGLFTIFIVVKLLTPQAIKPIEVVYNKQKRFMTDIMHELKTPLAIIETNTEVVEIDYGKTEWTTSIRKQIHYLKDLLNDLVTLLKMDENTQKLDTSKLNLSELLENALTGFESLYVSKGFKLNIDYDNQVEIIGNEDSIEHLISIILENTLKYTSGEKAVSIRLKKNNKKVIFEIENSIDSITEGNHEEYFDRFYRSDLSRNSNLGGHGIGLSIAKEIVLQNKGNIKAYSKNNHSFSILITF